MHSELIPYAVAVFVLMLLSAFFSGGETAMTACSQARMLAAEKDGSRRAGLVNKILQKKERMIGAMLLGNTLINILASALTTSILVSIWGDAGVLIATAVMTVLILIFCEVMPKTYAIHNADAMAKFMAPAINIVILFLSPVVDFVAKVVRATLKFFGADISKVSSGHHLDMLRGAIEMYRGPDEDIQKQRSMLRSILELADVSVGEVMIHRKNVVTLDISLPPARIIDEVYNSSYSRVPLWRDHPDNIVGLIHSKWLLRELKAVNNDPYQVNIEMITVDPWFVPDSTSLYEQLQSFRERGEHFAFVVDEYGSYMGIVTLEDILEEIVGEISDEHDIHVPGLRRQPNGSYLVTGSVTIRDLHRELDWELPDQDYTTVAGLLLHESQRIPDVGQSFTFFGFRFDVIRRHRNQITLVRITPPAKEESSEANLLSA
jgi:Mg2+/Co2+ transporter CorB